MNIAQKFRFTDEDNFYFGQTCIIEKITDKSVVYSFGYSYNVSFNNITKQRYGIKKFNTLIETGLVEFI
tara:strand:- start:301 stop:507 length:207 start_codon:yes stop_codon:yes gene_type:complete